MGVIVVLLLVVASAAGAPQGFYERCDITRSPDVCAQRLERIAGAGFRAVTAGPVTEDSVRAYAAAADKAGVRVVWDVRSAEAAQRFVPLLKDLPSTWGYYIADEPKLEDAPALAELALYVRSLDPNHPRLVVGCGVCAGGAAVNVAWLADLDVHVGTDAYPVFGGPEDPGGAYAKVAANVVVMSAAARARGRGQVVVLQAWRWGDSSIDSQAAGVDPASTRFPTSEEVRAMRDAAVDHAQPDLILWFMLSQVIGWPPGQQLSYWLDPTDTADRWARIVDGAFAPPRAVPPPPPPPAAALTTPRVPVLPSVGWQRRRLNWWSRRYGLRIRARALPARIRRVRFYLGEHRPSSRWTIGLARRLSHVNNRRYPRSERKRGVIRRRANRRG